MGLLDKAKAQAQTLAQKGQEAAKKGQEKVQAAQSGKRGDALLRDLGAAVYAEKTGKATAETAAEIERLVAELRSFEEEHGAVDTTAKADKPQDAAGEAGTEGNFSIDDV
jgi:hypothetical protein